MDRIYRIIRILLVWYNNILSILPVPLKAGLILSKKEIPVSRTQYPVRPKDVN